MSTRYKQITVKSSASGTPTPVFVPEDATVAAILEKAGVNIDKSEVLIGAETVAADFVPEGDATITVNPKKYSSGFKF